MVPIGQVEKYIYKLREEHPLVIPQLDPDKFTIDQANDWFKQVSDIGIKFIALGGSTAGYVNTQELLEMASKDYDLTVALYLTASVAGLKGQKGKTAIYWSQVPYSQNTFYGWDGLVSNSLYVEKNDIEPLPTVYVFDDRNYTGTSHWITRSSQIPSGKPEISLAVGKAAQFLGIRFYIMAGGSGSPNPPSTKHVEKLAKHSQLFVIPTSGINTADQAKELFAAGADAVHIGNRLEQKSGFKDLEGMFKAAKLYEGRKFL